METKRFAQYYVDNYAEPQNRVTSISFRSMHLTTTGSGGQLAAPLRAATSTTGSRSRSAHPAAAASTGEQFFVEGIHETYRPLGRSWTT